MSWAPALTPLPHTPWRRLAAAGRWWCDELAALLPLRLVELLDLPRGVVLVAISGDDVRVGRAGRGETATELRLGLGAGPLVDWPASLRAALARGEPVRLRLAEETVLRRTLVLPWAALRRLPQLLALELERLSPLPPDRLVYDYRITALDRVSKRLTVTMRLVQRQQLAEQVAQCNGLGLSPNAVVLAEGPPLGRPFIELPAYLPPRRRWMRRLTVFLAGLVIALAAAGEVVALRRDAAVLQALTAQLAEARAEAQAVEASRDEAAALRRLIDALPRRKQKAGLGFVLAEATRRLPDHTWLFQLERDGHILRLKGYSTAASSLIGLLDSSPLFVNAQFRAPLIPGLRDGLERFDLSVEIIDPAEETKP